MSYDRVIWETLSEKNHRLSRLRLKNTHRILHPTFCTLCIYIHLYTLFCISTGFGSFGFNTCMTLCSTMTTDAFDQIIRHQTSYNVTMLQCYNVTTHPEKQVNKHNDTTEDLVQWKQDLLRTTGGRSEHFFKLLLSVNDNKHNSWREATIKRWQESMSFNGSVVLRDRLFICPSSGLGVTARWRRRQCGDQVKGVFKAARLDKQWQKSSSRWAGPRLGGRGRETQFDNETLSCLNCTLNEWCTRIVERLDTHTHLWLLLF